MKQLLSETVKNRKYRGELTIGDIVLLEGDNVPADLRIIESHDLLIDESAMTGESFP